MEERRIDTAAELLALLRRSNDQWFDEVTRSSRWLFRGEASTDYDPTPSAWRENDPNLKFFQDWVDSLQCSFFARARERFANDELKARNYARALAATRAEVEIVEAFCAYVDSIGQHIPGDRIPAVADLNLTFDEYLQRTGLPFSPFALARHHGAPSRFLDWTRNPLYAAFFAAHSVGRETAQRNPDNCIAVWAVHENSLRSEQNQWEIASVLRSHVGFLHAQEAILVWRKSVEDHYAESGQWPSFLMEVGSAGANWLLKFTLRNQELPELLGRLSAENVDLPHLMPTFDVIKETLVAYLKDLIGVS